MWSGRKTVTTELNKTPESDEQTMNDVFELFEPTDNVTTEVIEALKAAIGEVPVTEIGGLKKHELAKRIKAAVPTNTMKVAGEVLDYLRENEYVTSDAPATAAAPQGPFEVTVNMPKGVNDLTLQELIERIIADPSQSDDLIPIIRGKRPVTAAETKTREWAIANTGGGLNITATVEYVTFLARPHTVVQRKWNGDWPTTLERALGLDRRVMIHPFMGQPLDGPDEFGFDWTKLSDEQHEAVLWAILTHHRNLPASPDVRRMSDELFADELPGYWKEIVEDYTRAKARGESSTRSITRYVPEDVLDGLSGHTTAAPKPEMTEEDYRISLHGVAMSGAAGNNSECRRGQVVIQRASSHNGDIVLNGTIVLDGGYTHNGDLRGTCYVPPGSRSFGTHNGHDSLNVYPRSWRQLYELAVSYNLI